MTYANPLNLGIKAPKTWRSDDGGGYQFTLTRDGRPVAFVHQGGFGGPTEIKWDDARTKTELDAFTKTLPHDTTHGVDLAVNTELYVEVLFYEADADKRFDAMVKRYRKTNTLFVLPGDEPRSFRHVKSLNVASVRAMLDKKYGANGYTLI